MIYRQTPEKKIVEVKITLSSEEYKEAILEYLVKYKMLPDGVEIVNVKVAAFDNSGNKIKPGITYCKNVLKLYS